MDASNGSDDSPERPAGQALANAAVFVVEPIRLTLPYRVGLAAATLVMLLLPLIYVGLIVLVLYGVWYHAVHNYGILGSGYAQVRIVAYFAPIMAGSLGALFMVKPLFAPPPPRPAPRPVTRDEQPLLFRYVENLCASLGAPAPRRIDVDMQVNASASFRKGLASFLGRDLVLTVGLPLTAGMTLGQWTGVLAHEFGHFTQGAAMRLSYVIGSVNHWFARVVHERDAWDERIDRWTRESRHWVWGLTIGTARLFIGLSRGILRGLMAVGLAVSAYLSRQMEFNADMHQARVSGSELFRATHLRLPLLSIAWQSTTGYLDVMLQERRLVDDVVRLVVSEADRLSNETGVREQIQEGIGNGTTGAFDTHPATIDRIRAAERRSLPALLQNEEPATVIFEGFDRLSEELTASLYERALGGSIDALSPVPADVVIAERNRRIEGTRVLHRYFLGTDLMWVGVFAGATALRDEERENLAERIAGVRARMASAVPEVADALRRLDEGAKRRRALALFSRARRAGLKVEPASFGLTVRDGEETSAARAAAILERAEILEFLAPHTSTAAERLHLALGLAPRAEVAGPPAPAAVAVGQVEDLAAVLAALAPHWPQLHELQDELAELDFLLEVAGGTPESGPLREAVFELLRSIHEAAAGLRDGLAGLDHPYARAHETLSVGAYLFESLPEPGPETARIAAEGSARAGQLYFRVWSDLAALALEAEDVAGLPALEPPEVASAESV